MKLFVNETMLSVIQLKINKSNSYMKALRVNAICINNEDKKVITTKIDLFIINTFLIDTGTASLFLSYC